MEEILIRQASIAADYEMLWRIFKEVVKTGDTYVFSPDTSQEDFQKHWFRKSIHTYVLERNEKVLGTYILKPNQIDLGNHIANGSYMVHPNAQRQGIGEELCIHSLKEAKRLGFKAIQFNFVVSTNLAAIKLWKKHGFEVIGTIPEAFRHQKLGLVAAYIMYKKL